MSKFNLEDFCQLVAERIQKFIKSKVSYDQTSQQFVISGNTNFNFEDAVKKVNERFGAPDVNHSDLSLEGENMIRVSAVTSALYMLSKTE